MHCQLAWNCRDVARIFTVGGLSHRGAETKSQRCLGGRVWGAGVPLPSVCTFTQKYQIDELCLGGLTFSLGAEAPPSANAWLRPCGVVLQSVLSVIGFCHTVMWSAIAQQLEK